MTNNDTAVLILDMQMNMFADGDSVYKAKEVLQNIRLLLAKAREAQIPVIYLQNNGGEGEPDEPQTPGWHIHQAIAPAEHDVVIQKNRPNAFYKTNLQQVLDDRKIKKLIIAGLQTEMCIDTTCRQASALEYDVILVEDAHTTYDTEILTASQVIEHHNDILGVFADTCCVDEVKF